MSPVSYHRADVNGLKIFYRQAGKPGAPKLLLLHGFPSASHMFRDIISLLADRFHLVAPDLPGFGKYDMPARGAIPSSGSRRRSIASRRWPALIAMPSMSSITAHRPGSG